jgi:hypothetical protein
MPESLSLFKHLILQLTVILYNRLGQLIRLLIKHMIIIHGLWFYLLLEHLLIRQQKFVESATPNNCGYCPIEGMWYGPRYNVSGCADWEELNGYVDVGFDFLVSEGNQLGKYCTFIMGHEITETCNFQNMLDVWGFHTKWSNWVPNFPPCCYE